MRISTKTSEPIEEILISFMDGRKGVFASSPLGVLQHIKEHQRDAYDSIHQALTDAGHQGGLNDKIIRSCVLRTIFAKKLEYHQGQARLKGQVPQKVVREKVVGSGRTKSARTTTARKPDLLDLLARTS